MLYRAMLPLVWASADPVVTFVCVSKAEKTCMTTKVASRPMARPTMISTKEKPVWDGRTKREEMGELLVAMLLSPGNTGDSSEIVLSFPRLLPCDGNSDLNAGLSGGKGSVR